MIKHKSIILNKLFYSEMKALVKKFDRISESEIVEIEEIFESIENENTKSYLLNNSIKLQEIVKENRRMKLQQGEIELFSWINSKLEEVNISKVREYYEELQIINYIEIDDYIIYKQGCCLKEYAYSVLEERLKDEFWVDTMFTKDDIVEMWVNETTKEEALEEIIENNDIEESLGLEPQYAFKIKGIQYIYSQIEE